MTRLRVRYFAYGSNMLTDRLRETVPSPKAIGIANSWDMRLRGTSAVGGRVGQVRRRSYQPVSDVVWGVVFELDRKINRRSTIGRRDGAGLRGEDGGRKTEDRTWYDGMPP